ncbi:MAG: hypothetical protein ACXWIG_15085 [Caldimonas sp.]
MGPDQDLYDRYRQLRRQLDAAYAAPVWDGPQIDRIAEQLIPVVVALASARLPLAAVPEEKHD